MLEARSDMWGARARIKTRDWTAFVGFKACRRRRAMEQIPRRDATLSDDGAGPGSRSCFSVKTRPAPMSRSQRTFSRSTEKSGGDGRLALPSARHGLLMRVNSARMLRCGTYATTTARRPCIIQVATPGHSCGCSFARTRVIHGHRRRADRDSLLVSQRVRGVRLQRPISIEFGDITVARHRGVRPPADGCHAAR